MLPYGGLLVKVFIKISTRNYQKLIVTEEVDGE